MLLLLQVDMYVSSWQAHSLALHPQAASPLEAQRLRCSNSRGETFEIPAEPALSAAAAVLQQLQLAEGSQIRLAAVHQGPTSGCGRGNGSSFQPVGAATAVLARVAAAEDFTAAQVSLVSPHGSRRAANEELPVAQIEGGMAYTAKLLPILSVSTALAAQEMQTSGAAIVTGGLSGLGLLTGLWMTQRGCNTLTLLGRSGRGSGECAALLNQPALVTLQRCNVSIAAEAQAAVTEAAATDSLAMLVHAGGVLRDGLLKAQSLEGMREVWAPKVGGAKTLATAAACFPAKFAAFSSIAGVFGSPGQGNYAAANAAMDAWAQHRNIEVS